MHAAVAGLSGGLIAVISTFYFALRAFGHGQDATPERLLDSLLRAGDQRLRNLPAGLLVRAGLDNHNI